MAKIKYMGIADEMNLSVGDTLGGRLGDSLTVAVQWSRANNWIVDTDDLGNVPDEAWEILLTEFPETWKDVSDFKRVPLNDHQRTFLAMSEGDQKTVEEETAEAQENRRIAMETAAQEADAANYLEDLHASTKEDLLEKAAKVNIEGRSSMNKDELVEALSYDYLSKKVDRQLQQVPAPATPDAVPASGATTDSGGGTTTVGGSTDEGSARPRGSAGRRSGGGRTT